MLSMVLPILELSDYHRQLTDYAIANLRETADATFELVIVETAETPRLSAAADVHVHKPNVTSISNDMNAGLEEASGDVAGHTANDIVVAQGWDSALLRPWDLFGDCGATTLLADSHRGQQRAEVEEGFYGPIMTYEPSSRFDAETFPNIFADTDLVMRIYREGRRMYRNWRSRVRHIGGGEQTWRDVAGAERPALFAAARDRFWARHQDSGLMMARALYEGWPI